MLYHTGILRILANTLIVSPANSPCAAGCSIPVYISLYSVSFVLNLPFVTGPLDQLYCYSSKGEHCGL